MKVDGKAMRSIWLEPNGWSVGVIDQTVLPHRFATARLTSLEQAAHAIRAMVIRGAPLIGATAAYGIVWRCATMPPTKRSSAPTQRCLPRGPLPST